jgi:hypothetical protein
MVVGDSRWENRPRIARMNADWNPRLREGGQGFLGDLGLDKVEVGV